MKDFKSFYFLWKYIFENIMSLQKKWDLKIIDVTTYKIIKN